MLRPFRKRLAQVRYIRLLNKARSQSAQRAVLLAVGQAIFGNAVALTRALRARGAASVSTWLGEVQLEIYHGNGFRPVSRDQESDQHKRSPDLLKSSFSNSV